MTIWEIIIYWLISEVISWGLFGGIYYWIFTKKIKDLYKATAMCIMINNYSRSKRRFIEWIRFVIWPYGIIQRAIIMKRVYKKAMFD